MKNKQIVETIIVCLGGEQNIVSVTNCMTRLRVVVKNEALVNEGALKTTKKVLGLVHDREFCYEIVVGPGHSRKFADITEFAIGDREVADALGGIDSDEEHIENTLIEDSETDEKCHETDRKIVSHGDRIFFGAGLTGKAGKQIETDTESVNAKSSLSVSAVADGELIAMSEIPDPVFSDGTMGECFGIMPSNGNVYSPVEGTVIFVAETGHAMGLKAGSGEEFLIHAGIDTVSLGHKAFAHYVSSGAYVKKNQLLMTVDLEMVKAAALSPVIIVIALN